MRFKNKTVLVTGASRGIGKEIALQFAKEGANIMLNYFVSDYEPDASVSISQNIKEMEVYGGKIESFQADISDSKSVILMRDFVKNKFDGVDILVNNAGYVIDVEIEKRSEGDFMRTLNTNLYGCFSVTKEFAEILNIDGSVINISSTNGINTNYVNSIDYDAAKAGIISLTKNFAIEFADRGINVNALAPGWVNTEMNKQLGDDFIKNEENKILLKRFAEPYEIAKSVLFLASEDASYITGTVLVIDGGMKLI